MTLKEIEELAGHRKVSPWVVKLVGDAVAKEREACWKIACEYTQLTQSHTCLAVADAIRARGQA